MQIDPALISSWLQIVLEIGLPLVLAIVGVWKKNESVDKKIAEAVPLVWAAVQQALRKGDGKLPGGKAPLAYALELVEGIVGKLNPKQKQLAETALRAHHEHMGAPDAKKV